MKIMKNKFKKDCCYSYGCNMDYFDNKKGLQAWRECPSHSFITTSQGLMVRVFTKKKRKVTHTGIVKDDRDYKLLMTF